MEPVKKKKPPACDRCKAKRVLCHPDPSGCPRCKEKGFDCTTTPVVRRKPQKRSAQTGSAPTPALSAPSLPPAYLASGTATPSTAWTSQNSPSDSAAALPVLTPDLARHLFHCYEQTTVFDHAIFQRLDIRKMFESCGYNLSRLDPSRRVLAYAICALASFMSFHPSIIGEESPRPTSFTQIGTPVTGTDLRAFGRRRRGACCALRNEAERMAKEADVAFGCSAENAATAMLLDWVACFARADDPGAKRPWMAAYTSHVRELADNPTNQHGTLDTLEWAIFLSADIISELDSGRLSFSRADQLALAGTAPLDVAQLDKQLKEKLQSNIDPKEWPDIRALSLAYVKTAQRATETFLGTHARREPFNHQAFQAVFSAVDHLRSVQTSFDRLIDFLDPEPTENVLFPHALPRRNRWTRSMALQGRRSFASYVWTSLVLPLYRELLRREGLDAEEAQAAATRELVLVALESKISILKYVPHLGATASIRRLGYVDWSVVLLEELDSGAVVMSEKLAGMADGLAAVLKLAGYVYSDVEIDRLILRLESHALAFRLAQSTSSAGALHLAPPQPFAFFEQGQGMNADMQLFQQQLVAAGGSGSYPEVPQPPPSSLSFPLASLMSLSPPSPHVAPIISATAMPAAQVSAGLTTSDLGGAVSPAAPDWLGLSLLSASTSASGGVDSTSATPFELEGSWGGTGAPFAPFDAALAGLGAAGAGEEEDGVQLAAMLGITEAGMR